MRRLRAGTLGLTAIVPSMIAGTAGPAAADPADVADEAAPAARVLTIEEAAGSAEEADQLTRDGVIVTTEGAGVVPDQGEIAPGTVGDDEAPGPLRATAGGAQAAAAGGSRYTPKGGSLIPPYGGWYVYWDAPGSGYEVRGMSGVESLGSNVNYVLQRSNQKSLSAFQTNYARRLVTKQGGVYEGCYIRDSTYIWCDFSSNRIKPEHLPAQRNNRYWWRVLRDWGSYQTTVTGKCATTIIQLWTGQKNLYDAGSDCRQAGPYTLPT